MLIKQESISLEKPDSWDFWQIANSILNQGKCAIPPLFSGIEVLSSASDKAILFLKNFSKNYDFDGSGISLPIFHSRTNLKLNNISVTPNLVKKTMTNLDSDSSKMSGLHCNPLVVPKNCETEVSYILAELFNICLKECCFSKCWKVLSFKILAFSFSSKLDWGSCLSCLLENWTLHLFYEVSFS